MNNNQWIIQHNKLIIMNYNNLLKQLTIVDDTGIKWGEDDLNHINFLLIILPGW